MENNNQQPTSQEVNQQNVQYIQQKETLSNSTAVLVLGILSIVFCLGLGVVLGIVALVMSKKPLSMYAENQKNYSQSSYSNMKAGRTMAIIGLIVSSIGTLIYTGYIIWMIYFFNNITESFGNQKLHVRNFSTRAVFNY